MAEERHKQKSLETKLPWSLPLVAGLTTGTAAGLFQYLTEYIIPLSDNPTTYESLICAGGIGLIYSLFGAFLPALAVAADR